MRTVSTSAMAGYLEPYSASQELIFAEISHAAIGEAIRVVADVKDFVWGGQTHIGVPFQLKWLSDGDGPPRGTVTMQNVDRRLGEIVRAITSPPEMVLTVLLSDDFDLTADPRTEIGTAEIIVQARHLRLANVRGNAGAIRADITSFDFGAEPWPFLRATIDQCPGLYW